MPAGVCWNPYSAKAMDNIYFPSCNFAKASPQAAKKLRERLKALMPVAGCCRVDPKEYPPGSQGLYVCQACRETLESRFPQLIPKNLFVWLDQEEPFPFPDYRGLTVSIQDCWRDREHPEIHQAVRSLLKKMGIQAREIPENRENADSCGDLHFPPRIQGLASPKEDPALIFAGQLEKHKGLPVLCYCNRCKAGIETAGGQGIHLLELVMGAYN